MIQYVCAHLVKMDIILKDKLAYNVIKSANYAQFNPLIVLNAKSAIIYKILLVLFVPKIVMLVYQELNALHAILDMN